VRGEKEELWTKVSKSEQKNECTRFRDALQAAMIYWVDVQLTSFPAAPTVIGVDCAVPSRRFFTSR